MTSKAYKDNVYMYIMEEETIQKENMKGGEEKMPVKLIQVKQFCCYRCGHEWQPRKDEDSITCPNCRSPYWNKPKKASTEEDGKQ